MDNVLSKIYNGELNPAYELKPIIEEYQKKRDKLLFYERKFVSKLDKELIGEFNDLMAEVTDLIPDEMSEVFAQGFSLGVRMMVDRKSVV